ncbi:hypothetical protein K461DRAFT_280038 [Myriangium duriaei CBS 260.36]|uniref:Uncharacterized protein n=1 Tax=Myriangium duriaei CBS 260.36 TaxID=1168546 RepID=A0A9P4IYY2_9PEZI|nr:hypothetical protein K461DRAFT_280038 [Myriangium duriaei CBS 260.36]
MQPRNLLVSPPSPTLTNPDMVLPDEGDAQRDGSAALSAFRPPSPTYLLEQVDMVTADHGDPVRKKSLGSMSQRQGLQRATTADDNPHIPGSFVEEQEQQEMSKPRWEQRPIQRSVSILSTSTISLDLDAIPEYKYDDGESESDIFTLDGTVTPTRSTAGDFEPNGSRPVSGRRTSEKFSAELSRRAELILANAKKRLNLMDKNLKGARALTAENLQRAASLHIHESPYTNRFLRSPDDNGSPDTPTGKKMGHLRNRSDITQLHSPVRAQHALVGETLAEESDDSVIRVATPLRMSRSQELPRSSRLFSSSRSVSRQQLKPTPEGQEVTESNGSSPVTDDLKKQVQSLNKRISLLRERTKEDSMKRQSFQNLRQPSPFTNAEHNRSASGGDQSMESRWSADSSVKHLSIINPTSGFDNNEAGRTRKPERRLSKRRSKTIDWTPIRPQNHATHKVSRFSMESAAEDSSADDINHPQADLSSVSEYSDHDADASPPGPAHEDREDAFDYHNFFLHSSLGRTSRQSTSSSSSHSTASDDTARGTPGVSTDETPEKLRQIEHKLHRRFSSFDSTTSDASYATAAEARAASPLKHPSIPREGSDGADSGVALPRSASQQEHNKNKHLSIHVAAKVADIGAPQAAIAVAAVCDPTLPALGLRDKALLFMLMESVQTACARLQEGAAVGKLEGQVLRRRLEEARRVMDGSGPVVSHNL